MGRLLAFILGVAGALIGSQGPGFTLQYMQNVQGRVDELRPIVEQYDADVAAYGYSREQAMTECATATQLLDALCNGYRTTVERYEALTAHLAILENAGDFVRPLILGRMQAADEGMFRDIAMSVYKQFEPAIPTTLVGGAYAAGGFALLWGAASAIFGIIGGVFGGGRRYA